MKNSPMPNRAMITEAAVRRKEDTENRNNRTATRTVSKTINGAAISLSISLIALSPFLSAFYLYFTMRAQGQQCCRRLVNLVPAHLGPTWPEVIVFLLISLFINKVCFGILLVNDCRLRGEICEKRFIMFD